MKPIKGKKYRIHYKGPFFYNDYFGDGVCNGEIEKMKTQMVPLNTGMGSIFPKKMKPFGLLKKTLLKKLYENS